MKLSFIAILTEDKLELPALLYRPDQPTKQVAIWLHGMGDSGIFYNPEWINILAQAHINKGIAFLALNNRGAHNIKTIRLRDDALPEEGRSYQGGTYYERIAECVKDIDGAVKYLKANGYADFYLEGHSTGANKICAYHDRVKNNPFSKYVLAGPGDDSGLFFNELGEKRFKLALNHAKTAIKQKQPLKIMPKYTGMYPFSAQAAEDILDPDGDYNTFPFYEYTTKRLGKKPLFKEFKNVDIATLVIFGSEDEYAYTAGGTKKALDIFRHFTNKKIQKVSSYQLVDGTDHSFHGAESQFAKQLVEWLVS